MALTTEQVTTMADDYDQMATDKDTLAADVTLPALEVKFLKALATAYRTLASELRK